MTGAQQVVDLALAAASGRCDETIVIGTDRAEASLRWAGNSMTTNGASMSRTTSVISMDEKRAHSAEIRETVQRHNAAREEIEARARRFAGYDRVVRPPSHAHA